MTYEMEYLMQLYACGACGAAAAPPAKPLDWERLVQLAVEQSITYTVAAALRDPQLGCPEALRARLTTSMRGAAVKNAVKTEGMLALVGRMEAAGIRTVIVKGIDAARFYAHPECRVSSDTDLLVAPAQEAAAVEFLRGEGFQMQPRAAESNHAVGQHPALGMVELHISLLPEAFGRPLLRSWDLDANGLARSGFVTFDGQRYRALAPTDHLLFLTYHMIKHFLYGGISLRMMMDNALYARGNAASIDRARYAAALQETKYDYVVRLIFGAMVRYCGFSPADFPLPPATAEADMLAILDDLEAGGWQGTKHEAAALDAWLYYRYADARASRDRAALRLLGRDERTEYRRALFPPLREMQALYPSLRRHKWRYPFCLLHRLVKKLWLRLQGKGRSPRIRLAEKQTLSPEGQARVALFEQLKLL